MGGDTGVGGDTGMGRDTIEAAESFPASNEPKSLLFLFFWPYESFILSTYLIGWQLAFNK